MKILVSGPSVNLGSFAWPKFMEKTIDCGIVNLSMVGCGNQFIHDTVTLELSKRSYDLVIVTWTYFKRVDFRNKFFTPPEPFDTLNPHYDLLPKDWMFRASDLKHEHLSPMKENLYNHHALFHNNHMLLQQTLLNVISLQSILKSHNIPYLFTFYKKVNKLPRFENLYNMIDWDNVLPHHLYHIAKDNNWWFNNHPTQEAHEYYSSLISNKIQKKC